MSNYGIVLIEKEGVDGLSTKDVKKIMKLMKNDDVYPVEFPSLESNSSAMGFITVKSAEKVDFIYNKSSSLHCFISDIISSIKKDEIETYDFKGIEILLYRL